MGTNSAKLFGHPVFINMKRRVAKKYLRKTRRNFLDPEMQKQFANLSVGDFVNDCTGYNGLIKEIEPYYRRIGNGYLMRDVDIVTSNSACSFIHCGIEVKWTREKIEANRAEFLRTWPTSRSAEVWYGKKQLEAINRANELLAMLESGEHIVDEDGLVYPEYRFLI